MAQDLDFFLQKFICYGSGLRFFSAKNLFAMAHHLDYFLQKIICYGSGLEFFFQFFLLWLRT